MNTPYPIPTVALSPRYWPLWCLLGIAVLLGRLPWKWQRSLGKFLGNFAFYVGKSRRKAAAVNLALCFPQQTQQWRDELLKQSFIDFGIGVLEFARAWWGNIEPMRKTVEIEGLEYLQQLQAEGRGVLIVSGHFMTLELCGRLLCDHIPLAGMYRRYRNPVMEWAVTRGRLRYAKAMFANDDLRPTLRHLKKGGFLWYAPDQDMRGKDTVFAPFFGMPAATITATHQFARLTGCAVVPFFHRREGDRYILKVAPPLENFPSNNMVEDTTRINAAIEAMIVEAPSQYLWIHRRFKRQPEGRSTFYQ